MSPAIRSSALWVVSLTALLSLACGGGGGGGTAPPDNPAATFPDTLDYSIQAPMSGGQLLSAAFDGNLVQFLAIEATGTYNRKNLDATMDTDSMFTADTGGLYGNMQVHITQKIEWVGNNDPTSGAMRVDGEPGYATVTMNPDVNGTGTPGVDLAWYEQGAFVPPIVSLTWEEFGNLEDDEAAPDWQKAANFAYSGWQFLFKQVQIAFNGLVMIRGAESELEAAGGAGIPFAGAEFPPGSGQHGQVLISWLDSSGDQVLGPDDDFSLQYTNWWVDDTGSAYDDLYRGLLHLDGFIEATDPATLGADARFEAFEQRETEPDYTISKQLTVIEGGFHLLLSW